MAAASAAGVHPRARQHCGAPNSPARPRPRLSIPSSLSVPDTALAGTDARGPGGPGARSPQCRDAPGRPQLPRLHLGCGEAGGQAVRKHRAFSFQVVKLTSLVRSHPNQVAVVWIFKFLLSEKIAIEMEPSSWCHFNFWSPNRSKTRPPPHLPLALSLLPLPFPPPSRREGASGPRETL